MRRIEMLPDKFDVPAPSDFCKGTFSDSQGRKCSSKWIQYIFNNDFRSRVPKYVFAAWHKAADEVGIAPGEVISVRNDYHYTTKAQLAQAFERMLRRIGYDVK
jgi:hypothetical protein